MVFWAGGGKGLTLHRSTQLPKGMSGSACCFDPSVFTCSGLQLPSPEVQPPADQDRSAGGGGGREEVHLDFQERCKHSQIKLFDLEFSHI